MIVTLTANPSLDRTVELGSPLERGAVLRAVGVTTDPGGKGVNVARAVTAAGRLALAVLPGQHDDPLLRALRDHRIPHRAVPVPGLVRTNLTLTEPDGTTTKINQPGAALDAHVCGQLREALLAEAAAARWVVLAGSLPPGVPASWYAELVVALRPLGCRVAVDTSEEPLVALRATWPEAVPDLLKPNAVELAQLTGADPDQLEEAAARLDPAPAVDAAGDLVRRGVGAVLVTLGAAGAVLVTADEAWFATPPPVTPRSTVGAGDSSLAGYVLAESDGASPAERLRRAVAYGAAAASLPGSALPTPDQTRPDAVSIVPLPAPLEKDAV
ncbi:MAG: 1-phosphofructokinase family hexose kinase [Actinomycetes bacterium]